MRQRRSISVGFIGGWLTRAALVFLVLVGTVAAQQNRSAGEPPRASGPVAAVRPFKVQGNVWMIVGAGANVAMQVGDDGVVLVDTGAAGMGDAILSAVREVTSQPIRYIINTSVDADHVGNNARFAALAGGVTSGGGVGATPAVIAQENVLGRMSTPLPNGATPFPAASWPTDAYLAKQRDIFFNGEPIDIIWQPAAHTDGDSIVYFRSSNVLVSGDVFSTTSLPLIDRARGGSSAGSLAALNRMLDIAVPRQMQEGGTYIIPGHGRMCDEADLVEYRDMLHVVRDRVRDLVSNQKLPLEQIKQRRPLLGYAERYDRPEWNADMLVDVLYRELTEGSGSSRGASN